MKKRGEGRWIIIFLSCTLAVPTVAAMMGYYGAALPTAERALPALTAGALLGVAHLVLRPVLRVIFAPLGCLTLGLFGLVIDVGLLYICARMVRGFAVPGPLYAMLTALLINAVCAVAAGRR